MSKESAAVDPGEVELIELETKESKVASHIIELPVSLKVPKDIDNFLKALGAEDVTMQDAGIVVASISEAPQAPATTDSDSKSNSKTDSHDSDEDDKAQKNSRSSSPSLSESPERKKKEKKQKVVEPEPNALPKASTQTPAQREAKSESTSETSVKPQASKIVYRFPLKGLQKYLAQNQNQGINWTNVLTQLTQDSLPGKVFSAAFTTQADVMPKADDGCFSGRFGRIRNEGVLIQTTWKIRFMQAVSDGWRAWLTSFAFYSVLVFEVFVQSLLGFKSFSDIFSFERDSNGQEAMTAFVQTPLFYGLVFLALGTSVIRGAIGWQSVYADAEAGVDALIEDLEAYENGLWADRIGWYVPYVDHHISRMHKAFKRIMLSGRASAESKKKLFKAFNDYTLRTDNTTFGKAAATLADVGYGVHPSDLLKLKKRGVPTKTLLNQVALQEASFQRIHDFVSEKILPNTVGALWWWKKRGMNYNLMKYARRDEVDGWTPFFWMFIVWELYRHYYGFIKGAIGWGIAGEQTAALEAKKAACSARGARIENIPEEKNACVAMSSQLGVPAKTAKDPQATADAFFGTNEDTISAKTLPEFRTFFSTRPAFDEVKKLHLDISELKNGTELAEVLGYLARTRLEHLDVYGELSALENIKNGIVFEPFGNKTAQAFGQFLWNTRETLKDLGVHSRGLDVPTAQAIGEVLNKTIIGVMNFTHSSLSSGQFEAIAPGFQGSQVTELYAGESGGGSNYAEGMRLSLVNLGGQLAFLDMRNTVFLQGHLKTVMSGVSEKLGNLTRVNLRGAVLIFDTEILAALFNKTGVRSYSLAVNDQGGFSVPFTSTTTARSAPGAAVTVLKAFPSETTHLDLENCQMKDVEQVDSLAGSVAQMRGLQELNLRKVFSRAEFARFVSGLGERGAIFPQLHTLFLDQNAISNGTHLATLRTMMPALKVLNAPGMDYSVMSNATLSAVLSGLQTVEVTISRPVTEHVLRLLAILEGNKHTTTRFEWGSNALEPFVRRALIQRVGSFTHLEYLKFSLGDGLGDEAVRAELAPVLKNLTELHTVLLRHNGIGPEGGVALVSNFPSSVKHVALSGNPVGDKTFIVLGKRIRSGGLVPELLYFSGANATDVGLNSLLESFVKRPKAPPAPYLFEEVSNALFGGGVRQFEATFEPSEGARNLTTLFINGDFSLDTLLRFCKVRSILNAPMNAYVGGSKGFSIRISQALKTNISSILNIDTCEILDPAYNTPFTFSETADIEDATFTTQDFSEDTTKFSKGPHKQPDSLKNVNAAPMPVTLWSQVQSTVIQSASMTTGMLAFSLLCRYFGKTWQQMEKFIFNVQMFLLLWSLYQATTALELVAFLPAILYPVASYGARYLNLSGYKAQAFSHALSMAVMAAGYVYVNSKETPPYYGVLMYIVGHLASAAASCVMKKAECCLPEKQRLVEGEVFESRLKALQAKAEKARTDFKALVNHIVSVVIPKQRNTHYRFLTVQLGLCQDVLRAFQEEYQALANTSWTLAKYGKTSGSDLYEVENQAAEFEESTQAKIVRLKMQFGLFRPARQRSSNDGVSAATLSVRVGP